MGGDGGSIPGRADVVKTKSYGFKRNLGGMGYDPNTLVHIGDDHLSEDERRKLRFSRCYLTEAPLDPPIVADKAGNIFNKEALLTALINKKVPKELRIRRIKDVVQIVPRLKSETKTAFPVWQDDRLQCPVTGTAALGKADFLLSWRCGCLYSKKAAEELSSPVSGTCPVCGETAGEVIELVPRKKNEGEVAAEKAQADLDAEIKRGHTAALRIKDIDSPSAKRQRVA